MHAISTRLIMASSSAFLALVGIALSFLPQEFLALIDMASAEPAPLLLQVCGGSLVGWAMVNWMARGLVIGGIYSRPLTVGNLVHFVAASLALGKAAPTLGFSPLLLAVLCGYGFFAACFAYLVFGRGAACIDSRAQPD